MDNDKLLFFPLFIYTNVADIYSTFVMSGSKYNWICLTNTKKLKAKKIHNNLYAFHKYGLTNKSWII